MPNYCYNSFKITGSKESLEAFRKKYVVKDEYGNDHFDFHKVIPMPKALGVEDNGAAGRVYKLTYGIELFKQNPKCLGEDAFWIYQLIQELEKVAKILRLVLMRFLSITQQQKKKLSSTTRIFRSMATKLGMTGVLRSGEPSGTALGIQEVSALWRVNNKASSTLISILPGVHVFQ